MEQLKEWFESLDDRDQKITIVAGIAISIFMLYFILIEPVNESASKLTREVAAKQKTVNWMKKQIPIILSNKGDAGGNKSSVPLSTLVNNTTRKYALPVSRRDSKSPNEIQIWFDNVSFDSFLNWAAEVKSKYGVTLSSVGKIPLYIGAISARICNLPFACCCLSLSREINSVHGTPINTVSGA